jgi:predicted RNA-binding Zn-ribbon protein involved in translation (DUF1610 family)
MICSLCREKIPTARANLGYSTCLECGEEAAQRLAEQRKTQVAPTYNKGAYQYITLEDTKTIGR